MVVVVVVWAVLVLVRGVVRCVVCFVFCVVRCVVCVSWDGSGGSDGCVCFSLSTTTGRMKRRAVGDSDAAVGRLSRCGTCRCLAA